MTIKTVTVKKFATQERNIVGWAAERGIMDNSTAYAQYGKLEEEFEEVGEALEQRDLEALKLEIGDMYVVLTLMANLKGLTLHECATAAYEKIKDRQGYLNSEGVFVKEVA